MNKVWIVFAGDYSDRHTVAVLDNEADVDVIRSAFAAPDIEEWNIGPDTAPDLSKICGLKRYEVELLRSGEIRMLEAKRMDCDEDELWESPETTWWIEPYKRYIDVLCWAKDEEHAIKIAGEHLTMTIARGDWDEQPIRPGADCLGPISVPPGISYELGVVEPVSIGPEE